jgi:hypothetical protein
MQNEKKKAIVILGILCRHTQICLNVVVDPVQIQGEDKQIYNNPLVIISYHDVIDFSIIIMVTIIPHLMSMSLSLRSTHMPRLFHLPPLPQLKRAIHFPSIQLDL